MKTKTKGVRHWSIDDIMKDATPCREWPVWLVRHFFAEKGLETITVFTILESLELKDVDAVYQAMRMVGNVVKELYKRVWDVDVDFLHMYTVAEVQVYAAFIASMGMFDGGGQFCTRNREFLYQLVYDVEVMGRDDLLS